MADLGLGITNIADNCLDRYWTIPIAVPYALNRPTLTHDFHNLLRRPPSDSQMASAWC